MSGFTFPCPACGQDILSDTTQVRTQITCPGCNATIEVPEEMPGPVEVSTPATVQPAPSAGTVSIGHRTSRLAIASLVCSLLSLITCVGWLPGIICGHLAKAQFRRDSSLKGSGLATAGLVIGYLTLLLETGAAVVQMWRISAAVKHGYEGIQQGLATNQVIVTPTQSATVSNTVPLPGPVTPLTVTTTKPPGELSRVGWIPDLSQVAFPDHPASGKLHGLDFTAKTAAFKNGDLKLRSASGITLDIYHLEASIDGRSYQIQPGDSGKANPHVKMTWEEGGAIQTATFNQGYAMKLQFAQALNRTVSGKIYVCFPDAAKSCVAGTFQVRLPRSQ